MKPWNAWVACFGCAGLCLAMIGCGGGSDIPDPESDAHASKGTIPSAQPVPPPAVAQNEPAPQPAPAEPAPAPTPTPTPSPEPAAAATPAPATPVTTTEQPKPGDAAAKPESLAMSKPAADAPKPEATTSGTPAATPTATRETPAGSPAPAPAPVADAKPNPTPSADPSASAANNPFAVFSGTASTAPAAASPTPAPGATADAAAEGSPAAANPPAEGDRPEGALGYLNAAGSSDRGRSTGQYHSPVNGAMAFLKAVKDKDLDKIAEATALRAPIEASTRNQKLFAAILEKDLAKEDLDELAKKLENYQYAGTNQAKSSARLGIILTRPEGTSIMRRTITMRLEKAGWKVLDISGQGEIEKPIMMPRMRGNTGGRR